MPRKSKPVMSLLEEATTETLEMYLPSASEKYKVFLAEKHIGYIQENGLYSLATFLYGLYNGTNREINR